MGREWNEKFPGKNDYPGKHYVWNFKNELHLTTPPENDYDRGTNRGEDELGYFPQLLSALTRIPP